MTMVRTLRNRLWPARVAGAVLMGTLAWCGGEQPLVAQPPVHYHHAGVMPPGAIGSQQLLRGGPLPGYFQPVEILAPKGVQIAPAAGGGFESASIGKLSAAFLIGSVYRLRVTNIPLQDGVEVYPTVEIIDRIYPPIGQELKFPIPIELTQEELEMAAAGKFVTRVIYLEDPDSAEPVARQSDEQSYFEVRKGDNPLDVADTLGRPVAILRMGARVPDSSGPDEAFLYGCPPLVRFTPRQTQTPELLYGAEAREAPRGMRRDRAIERTSAALPRVPLQRTGQR